MFVIVIHRAVEKL